MSARTSFRSSTQQGVRGQRDQEKLDEAMRDHGKLRGV